MIHFRVNDDSRKTGKTSLRDLNDPAGNLWTNLRVDKGRIFDGYFTLKKTNAKIDVIIPVSIGATIYFEAIGPSFSPGGIAVNLIWLINDGSTDSILKILNER